MTSKVYKTAMGKTLDMGALILKNEQVRAVGNMNVNARGDLLDSTNQSIDKKNQQVQRQYRQSSQSSTPQPRKKAVKMEPVIDEPEEEIFPVDTEQPAPQSGLAAAMARTRATKKQQ